MIIYFAGQIGKYDLERISEPLFNGQTVVDWGVLLTYYDLIDVKTGKMKKGKMRKRDRTIIEFKRKS